MYQNFAGVPHDGHRGYVVSLLIWFYGHEPIREAVQSGVEPENKINLLIEPGRCVLNEIYLFQLELSIHASLKPGTP